MATRRKVSNLLGLAVLAYLSRQPMHPYELGRTLKSNGDERSIKYNHGSLYMVVQQLAKAGFVAPWETERDGSRPERTVYALTDAGRAELHDWLCELIEQPQREYPSFIAALSLVAGLPPSEVVPRLRIRADELAEQIAEARGVIDRSLAEGVSRLFLIEEEFRVAMLTTELDFVRRFIGEINQPGGYGRMWREFYEEK
ncbi:PadR family transcriptional regulator [Amycolatopsis sp. FDAARGOS 1241]|uniref:PadR family transcriptional regulator n=1 Tax=Amycolatopsis sp. FDAARGOS 1241 TaxID=2778070 RepID=UPI00194FF8C0|nr:PadR family transcriptional regulator [Amycolatopsis sp. FDAARGOS 1241]QRP50327.1 PadR family transcriptional regulator [Amycolatopsis sp. FDAARGOS 1241]